EGGGGGGGNEGGGGEPGDLEWATTEDRAVRLRRGFHWGYGLRIRVFQLYRFLVPTLLWSLGLACLDVYALKIKRDLHNPVTATLSLAAACSSAGVTVLFARDVHFCRTIPQFSCGRFEISVAFAFVTWLLISLSSLVMFWLLASV
ncbi:hypothetical protein BHM03_00059925, partial [Ensete ventricosum]